MQYLCSLSCDVPSSRQATAIGGKWSKSREACGVGGKREGKVHRSFLSRPHSWAVGADLCCHLGPSTCSERLCKTLPFQNTITSSCPSALPASLASQKCCLLVPSLGLLLPLSVTWLLVCVHILPLTLFLPGQACPECHSLCLSQDLSCQSAEAPEYDWLCLHGLCPSPFSRSNWCPGSPRHYAPLSLAMQAAGSCSAHFSGFL
jgi:hypothetical protein